MKKYLLIGIPGLLLTLLLSSCNGVQGNNTETEREEINVTKYIGNKTNKNCICIDEESYFYINGNNNSTFGKGNIFLFKKE